jgi:hypothetical protein
LQMFSDRGNLIVDNYIYCQSVSMQLHKKS